MAFRNYLMLPLISLLITIATVCCEELTVTPDVQYVDEGGNIEFTCQLPSVLLSGKGETLLTLKRQTTEQELILANGGFWVQSAYMGRSTATPVSSPDGHVLGYAFKIKDALPQDSGEYGCVKAVNVKYMGEPVYKKVYIKKQVQSIQMYAVAPNGTEIPLVNGNSYQLSQKENLRLMCRATGSVPAAKITVLLGLQDISKQLFEQTSNEVLVQEGDPQMNIYAYDTTLQSKEPFDIQVPQSVTCKADVEGVEGSHTFTIMTMFKHAPVIQCEETVVMEMAEDVALHCKLSAVPDLQKFFWFIRLPTGNNITLDASTQHYAYHLKTENLGNLTSTKLFIDRVFKNHFENEYFLFAENAEGAAQTEVILKKDPRSGKMTGSASTMVVSALLLFVSAIFHRL